MNQDGSVANASAKSRRWTGRTRGGVLGNWFFYVLMRFLGLRFAYACLSPVVFYFLLFAPRAVKASSDYRRRLGYMESSWLNRIWNSYKHFLSFGKILLDRAAIIALNTSKFEFVFEGEEHIRTALQEHKGVVMISAHCGNWEGAAHLLDRLDVPVNIVAYEGEAEHIRRFLNKAMANRSFSIISIDGEKDSSIAIMAALNRGEIVAMHADRCLGEEGMVIPFLGGNARFPVGPYMVSAISGAPLVCAFAMRQGVYRYHFYAYPAEHLAFSNRSQRQQALREWAGHYVNRLENILRQYPLQWHNFYDFWVSQTDSQQLSNKMGVSTR